MDKGMQKKLLMIFSVLLSIFGLVFLLVSIFTEEKNNTYLGVALASIIIANLLNIIRAKKAKNK